jgi:hypothetical protein
MRVVVVLLVAVVVMVLSRVQVMVIVVVVAVAVVVVVGSLKDGLLGVERGRRVAELHLDRGGAREVGAGADLGELAIGEGAGH